MLLTSVRRRVLALACGAALAGAGVSADAAAAPADPDAPPGAPGAMSHFDLARKDCVGTARNRTSKVWFTVAGGVLSDVYYPTVDTTNVETLQYVVTDGSTFTDLQTRDTTYTVAPLEGSGMSCRVVSTARSGRYRLTTDYLTDPEHDAVLLRTTLTPKDPRDRLRVYARLDATANGNGGGGDAATANAGADDAVTDTSTGSPVPVAGDPHTATIAAHRDYATPVYLALRADRPFSAVSNGYAGTASDGLAQLDAGHRLTATYPTAGHGNVVQTAALDLASGRASELALGFGTSQAAAVQVAGAGLRHGFADAFAQYRDGWADYDAHLRPPPAQPAGLARAYYLSANVLKASEDKTFPGAIVAGLASPWGQAVAAGDPALTYFGSYREVFARDLYETFTGLVADGDLATARDTVRFLFERQQQPDGSMPRNSLVNGATAPDSFGVQLDEVAYPILMARTVGQTDRAFYTAHLKRAADFLVAHGPAFGSERWEEQSGYSPSTIAAEIAGLTAAAALAERAGDAAGARVYHATADHYQRNIKAWTRTTKGPLDPGGYFVRLSKNGDPNAAVSYNLGNGGPDADQRQVVDQGFLELPRLGVLHDDDQDVARSLAVVDRVISRGTPSGTGFYRYGTPAPGTEDGYGDCDTADPTDCTVRGKPWPATCGGQGQNKGSGHLWPVLAGERAEHELVVGGAPGGGADGGHAAGIRTAADLLAGMVRTGSGVGLIPEQVWEGAALAPSPYGTAPECASIGFAPGQAAGSASPLTWSAAQLVRLAADLRAGRITERPADTLARYVQHTQAGTSLTVTSPAEGAVVPETGAGAGTVTVSGTTAPGARVDVDAVNTDLDGAARTASATAAADGTFSVPVAVPPGTSAVTVAATAPDGATGYAQRTVVDDVVPGTLLLDAADPAGDDNGPGTYAYPTAADFHPGAYDLERFAVYDSGPDSVTFRVRTADLSPTFGAQLGAQLVDVYVRSPAGGATSTAAAAPGRAYQVSPAWNRLIEVQGFGQRFVDAAGATLGSVAIRASAATRYITFTVSKAALGGTPAAGWSFAVVLTGQDGFSPDLARGFTPTAQPYQFGVCSAAALAAGSPVCSSSVDPAGVPRAIDVLTPPGVSQADELDPTRHSPATIAGIAIGAP